MPKDITPKELILTIAGNGLLMFFSVLCAFGALISAFSLPVDLLRASHLWFFVCIILSAGVLRYRYKSVLVSLIPAFFFFIWSYEGIIEGARWLLFTLTDFYSNWLVVTVLFPESAYYEGDPTTFFIVAGIFTAILLSIAIGIHRSTFMTAFFVIPIILPAFVVVAMDYRPSFIYIFGLLAVLLTILLTNTLVFDDFLKKGLMTLPALLVAITFLGIAYFTNPPERFDRSAHAAVINRHFNAIATRVGNLWERRPDTGRGGGWPIGIGGLGAGAMWAFNTNYVDIAEAGSMNITNRNLLEVEVSTAGTFYLRGYSMQHFDGRMWSMNSNADMLNYARDEIARTFSAQIANYHALYLGNPPPLAGINITRTGDITNIDYIPYFIKPHFMENVNFPPGLSDHDIVFFHVRGSVHTLLDEIISLRRPRVLNYDDFASYIGLDLGVSEENIEEWLFGEEMETSESEMPIPHFTVNLEPYLQINESTAEVLREMVLDARINPNAPRTELVDAVARFIRDSAEYSLSPGIVPEGEDFVLYFLQYMESGFCIHFATAATLMLRSLGVPARFTTGYVFTVSGRDIGQTVTLTDENAHAWVEVFYDDVGWLHLEVTPGGVGTVIPYTLPHTPGGEEFIETPDLPTRPDEGQFMRDPEDLLYLDDGGFGASNPGAFLANQGGGGAGAAATLGLEPWQFNLLLKGFFVALVLISLPVRRHLILKHRKKRFTQPDTNAAVISMWRYIEKISSREAVPPSDIEELALKARFSHHRLSHDERAKVNKYAKRLADEIYRSKESDQARFWLKYARVVG